MPYTYSFNRLAPLFKSLLGFFLLASVGLRAQTDLTAQFEYDFNEHEIKEKNNKVKTYAPGVILTYDRFGNDKSAVLMRGDNTCYLNLGNSSQLLSSNISVSFWVNLERRNYMGKGNNFNPFFVTKNGPGEDYINALVIGYVPTSKHAGAASTQDSTNEAVVIDDQPFQFGEWYHYVVVCNNSYLALYVNGVLKQKTAKNFETQFYALDSMLVGHSGSKKNERMSIGSFDDFQIYHRSLTEAEIQELYHAPNPNRFNNFLNEFFKYGLIILGLVAVIILLVIRNKRALRRQKEQFELQNKISELELKVVKAQMNPHFISNCLAAIQGLIYDGEIEKASLYIAKFSFFLRQVLRYSDENYVSIAEEIEIIKLYVELEELRFKGAFQFNFVIDSSIDLKEILIPSLLTQPFIENAIWHGLLPLKKTREPRLIIRVLLQNGLPLIEIEDNGVGRDPTKVASHKSKGTKLAFDKVENLNRLSNNNHYKIEIIDLKDTFNTKMGTKIIIQLENLEE